MLQTAGRTGNRHAPILRAFTLIEVLVVVAIIALLVSILLPSLSKARAQAKSVACKGNLHDLGTAFNIYAETFKGYFPITPNSGKDTFWSLYRTRLLKSRDVLLCPSTENVIREFTLQKPAITMESAENNDVLIPVGDDTDIDKVAPEGRRDSSGGHSYEYNGVFNNNKERKFSTAKHHKRNTFFRLPFHNLLLVHDNDNHQDSVGTLGCTNSLDFGNNCPQTIDNHGAEGMNAMFGDGHADWMKKLTGRFEDYRFNTPKITEKNQNASIDRIWLASQYPLTYAER